jgi:hypothetical protein
MKYRDEWTSREDVVGDYGDKVPPEEQIVYASYTYEDYCGSALLVWRDDNGQWWENNDGHCSCYGLEQWEPETTSREALLMREGWTGLREAVEAVPA